MKFSIEAGELRRALDQVKYAAAGATTMPILGFAMLEIEDGRARMMATDLERFAVTEVELQAEAGTEGRVCIEIGTGARLADQLPGGVYDVEATGGRIAIRGMEADYELATLPAEDYPDFPQVEAVTTLVIERRRWVEMLGFVPGAIPSSDPRRVLMGILVEVAAPVVRCVATDGRRLTKFEIEPEEIRGAQERRAVIPVGALDGMAKFAVGGDEVTVEIGERFARCRCGRGEFVGKLIEGTYPKYEAVIPTTFELAIELPREALAAAVRRAGLFAERKYHSLVLRFSRGVVEVCSNSFEQGSGRERVKLDYDGEPFSCAMNHLFLAWVLKALPAGVMTMRLRRPEHVIEPVIFEVDAAPHLMGMVMPVRMADIHAEQARQEAESA